MTNTLVEDSVLIVSSKSLKTCNGTRKQNLRGRVPQFVSMKEIDFAQKWSSHGVGILNCQLSSSCSQTEVRDTDDAGFFSVG